MARPESPTDPYAGPEYHASNKGAVVRVVAVGALIGAAALGYVSFLNEDRGSLVQNEPSAAIVQEQQFAEAPPLPAEPMGEPAAAPTPTPAPVQRAPRAAVAPEPTPEPVITPEPAAPEPFVAPEPTPAPAPAPVTPIEPL